MAMYASKGSVPIENATVKILGRTLLKVEAKMIDSKVYYLPHRLDDAIRLV
jgi:hypothetical protein